MKNLIILLSLLLFANSAFAYDYSATVKNSIDVNQRINYSPSAKIWARNFNNKNINFVKHMTVGSGSFSEFLNNKKFYDTDTTYEFLNGNHLVGYNMHKLKFFELGFDKKITRRELSEHEIQNLFPNVRIVKISQFKNNKIVLKKPRGVKRTYMLVNDTDKDFYKYSFENYGNGTELIRGLFETDKSNKFIYSHFHSRDKDFPILKIVVKDSFFAK